MNGGDGKSKSSESDTPPPPPPDVTPKQGNLISKPSDVGDSSASLKDLLIEQGEGGRGRRRRWRWRRRQRR